jgi:hypothetical protein
MNIPNEYFETFNDVEISRHIHSFIAAKKLGEAMSQKEFLHVDNETTNKNGIVTTKFILCPATYADSARVSNHS